MWQLKIMCKSDYTCKRVNGAKLTFRENLTPCESFTRTSFRLMQHVFFNLKYVKNRRVFLNYKYSC